MPKPHDRHGTPFYDQEIVRPNQEQYIEELLERYKDRVVDDELKKDIWNDLQYEKSKGNITIPFKLAVRRDPMGRFPDQIEIILDTKV